jgi:hypothetical protein
MFRYTVALEKKCRWPRRCVEPIPSKGLMSEATTVNSMEEVTTWVSVV